jgi:broad specificity phosphatase PhoE
MELILVRHAEPAWATPEGLGRNDPGLTPQGREQAKAVAARLADPDDEPARGPVDLLVKSPAVRALETAEPIEAALGLQATPQEWLWEIGNPPEWEGAPIEQIEAAFARYKDGPFEAQWDGVPGSEPVREFHQRVIRGVRGFLADLGVVPSSTEGLWEESADAPTRVVAVAHAGTNSTIIAHLIGIEPQPWEWDRFTMGHASVAVLRTSPRSGGRLWSLASLGDANHLPLDRRTR